MNSELLNVLERLGFPIFISIALLWIIIKASVWLGREIIAPLKVRFFAHMDVVDRFLGKAPESLETIEGQLKEQSQAITEQTSHLEKQSSHPEKQSKLLVEVHKQLVQANEN